MPPNLPFAKARRMPSLIAFASLCLLGSGQLVRYDPNYLPDAPPPSIDAPIIVASDASPTRKLGAAPDAVRERLRRQESRSDGFHFDQSFNPNKAASVNRLGILLSEDACRLTPSPVQVPDANYLMVECPFEVPRVTLQFLSEAPFRAALVPHGRSLQRKLHFSLEPTGRLETEFVQSCRDARDSTSCYMVQIDARRLPNKLPVATRLIPMTAAQPVVGDFNPKQSEHKVTVFENEPVSLLLEAAIDSMIDEERLTRQENGFINQTHILTYRPRANSGATFYLSDREHAIGNNVTVQTETIPGSSPLLYDLRSSTGRLDPPFAPHQFAYFLRVHEFAQAVRLRLTAVDDVNTLCSYIDLGDDEVKLVVGHGATRFMPLPAELHPFVIDCVHPAQPNRHVRYIIQTVRQLGGSTLLRSLDVLGGRLQPPLNPRHKGPYTVSFEGAEDLAWVTFIAVPENKRAQVSVESVPCDRNTGHSPYFRVALGETRKFRIHVRTEANGVAETYEAIVARPSPVTGLGRRFGDIMGYVSTAVSSSRAGLFIHNAKLLQWVSMLGRINGLPESFDVWSRLFNKWNLQFPKPSVVHFVGFPTDTTAKHAFVAPASEDLVGPDSFVAPPQKYGVVTQPAAQAFEWSTRLSDWVVSLPASATIAASLQSLQDHDNALVQASGLLASFNATEADIDNLDFLTCKAGDDCRGLDSIRVDQDQSKATSRLDRTRKLLALSETDRFRLISHLELAYRNSQKVLEFTNSFTLTTMSLAAVAVAYVLAWSVWLHAPGDFASVRQDFPRILHPARFWLFVLDYALIAYTQACCGLLFTPLKDAAISLLGIETTPGALGTFCAVMLVVFPLTFVVLGCGLLMLNRGTLVYAKMFQRYADPRVGSYRAFWRPLPWLPIFGRLFDIEVSRVIEGHATDGNLANPQPLGAFDEERRTTGPWLEADNQRVFSTLLFGNAREGPDDQPLLGGNSLPTTAKYYKIQDAVKLGAPPYVGMGRNHQVAARFPEAVLAMSKQPVCNAYGQQLDVLCQIQLRHWAHIVVARDSPILIFPREHLEFIYADALNTLVTKSQMHNLFYWALDRISCLTLILLMSFWRDASGSKTLALFGFTSAVLALLYLPSVFATSLSAWYRQMEADFRLETEKATKYEREENEKFARWPFQDSHARAQFESMKEYRQRMKTSHIFYAFYDTMFAAIDSIMYADFWKTRLSFALGAFLGGPIMSEVCKLCVILQLAMGSRILLSSGSQTASTSTLVSISFVGLALICLNWEALKLTLNHLVSECLYEGYILARRFLIYMVDMSRDPRAVLDRVGFYLTQAVAYWTQPGGTVSFLYNGFQAETVRDFNCREAAVINNEVGVHMFGSVKVTESLKRQMFAEDDPLSQPRFTLQKTLVTAGTIAVHRPELDRAMPVVLPITSFNHNRHPSGSRVAATIQIVNHNTLRYVPKIRHDWQDDSFLTLYTDPQLVPPPGKIRRGLPGHGYVVKVDKVDQVIRIRGPGILAGKTYYIKLTYTSPQVDDRYPFDEVSNESSAHLSGRKEAECVCQEPGRLVVDVPLGYAPDLQEEMKIFPPDGREEIHDPARHKVVWDPSSRKMIIRTQHALLAGDQKYHVVWSSKPRGGKVHATTTEPAPIRGELRLEPKQGEEVIDLASTGWFVIRDTDKTMTIDIDLKETNAYEVLLSGVDLPGSSGYLSSKVGSVLGEIDCVFGGQTLQGEMSFERIPCTLVQCVDPVAKKWRVEPDFDEAIYRLSARKEELMAISEQLRRQFDSLSDLWYRVISPAEFVNFWRQYGLDVLDKDSNYVDPIRYPQDPRVRPFQHIVHTAEPALQQLLSSRLSQQLQLLTALQNEYKVWASAYRSLQLYDAQTNLDAVLGDPRATLEDRTAAAEAVRRLKRPFEQALPNFVYPLVVQEKLITRQSKWEAQFLRWETQLASWLHSEEGAARDRGTHGDLSCYEFNLYHIMRALKHTAYKPENLLRGRTQTALHYVTSSRAVRGMNTTWRPDPLGSCIVMMRVWGEDPVTRRPSPQVPRWEMCFLKLTTLGIKILFPYTKPDQTTELCPEEPWNSVNGWFIPLRCFEAMLCMEDRAPLSEDECAYDFADTMTGRLVFRRNTDASVVHDNYVLRLSDRMFDNSFSGHLGARQFIQLGFTSDGHDLDNALPRELWYEQQQAHDKFYSYPLSFRMWPHDLQRWDSVIAACHMDKPPRDNGDFDGRAPGNEPPTPSPLPPPPEPPTFEVTDRDADTTLVDWSPSPMEGDENQLASESTEPIMADEIEFEGLAPPQTARPASPNEPSPHVPTPPVSRDKAPPPPPYDSTQFLGEQQDWRFHGVATLHDRDGAEVFDGQLHEGQRNGHGVLTFFRGGSQWRYEGGFVHDEPCGTGSLTLMDPTELDRLRRSKDNELKKKIVGFSGTFSVPKEMTRNDTLPTAAHPTVDMAKIQQLFDEDPPPHLLAPTDTERLATPRRAERPTEDSKLAPWQQRGAKATWDLRRSISACGHEAVLDVSLGTLNETFFYGRAPKDRSDMTPDDFGLPIGDGRVGRDEFLPHTGRWARVLEPSLGYQDIGARMGLGEVAFADGTRFVKIDARGLVNDRPNGRGHFHCPHCPLNYFGEFRNGRPDGYGCLEVGEGENKVTYWGGFRDGKRHGEGTMVSHSDKIFVEGHFENDRLSGGNGRIDVHPDMESKTHNFQWVDAEFKNGRPDGRGAINFFRTVKGKPETGLTYRGEFKEGLRNGLGVVYDTDDQPILKSEWLNDAPSGRADAYYLRSGHVYVGPMKRGARSGMGKLFESIAGGLIYDGMWDEGLPHGRGTLHCPEGVYEGEFFHGKRHGKGVLKLVDSTGATGRREYEGSWLEDKPHGVGLYKFSDEEEPIVIAFEDGHVKSKSVKKYRQGGYCGTLPQVPELTVSEIPALEDKHAEYQEKCNQLRPDSFTAIQEWGGDLWAKHEGHPFVFTLIMGDMPERPQERQCEIPRAPKPSKEDADFVFRMVIKHAKGLQKRGLRNPRASVRVGLLHHDVATKPDDVNGCDPVWNQTLILPFVRTQLVKFTVCDNHIGIAGGSDGANKESDRPLGYGIFKLVPWLESGVPFIEQEIPLELKDEKKNATTQVGTLSFKLEKIEYTPDMVVHRDQYDWAALRHHKLMPDEHKDALMLTVPPK